MNKIKPMSIRKIRSNDDNTEHVSNVTSNNATESLFFDSKIPDLDLNFTQEASSTPISLITHENNTSFDTTDVYMSPANQAEGDNHTMNGNITPRTEKDQNMNPLINEDLSLPKINEMNNKIRPRFDRNYKYKSNDHLNCLQDYTNIEPKHKGNDKNMLETFSSHILEIIENINTVNQEEIDNIMHKIKVFRSKPKNNKLFEKILKSMAIKEENYAQIYKYNLFSNEEIINISKIFHCRINSFITKLQKNTPFNDSFFQLCHCEFKNDIFMDLNFLNDLINEFRTGLIPSKILNHLELIKCDLLNNNIISQKLESDVFHMYLHILRRTIHLRKNYVRYEISKTYDENTKLSLITRMSDEVINNSTLQILEKVYKILPPYTNKMPKIKKFPHVKTKRSVKYLNELVNYNSFTPEVNVDYKHLQNTEPKQSLYLYNDNMQEKSQLFSILPVVFIGFFVLIFIFKHCYKIIKRKR